nr:ribosomal protein S9 [Chloromonas rosae]
MEILARAVGRRKEAVAQIQLVRGNGKFIINDKPAQVYLQNNSCSLICIKSPLEAALSLYSNNFSNIQSTSQDSALIKDQAIVGPSEHSILEANQAVNEKLEEQSTTSVSTEKSEILNNKESGVEANKGGSFELNLSGDETQNLNDSTHKLSVLKLNNLVSLEEIDVLIKVKGGGLIGQAEAIKLGIARAFCLMQVALTEGIFKKILKTKGYLTQDSRVKERRKYGLKKARKASQYHKR